MRAESGANNLINTVDARYRGVQPTQCERKWGVCLGLVPTRQALTIGLYQPEGYIFTGRQVQQDNSSEEAIRVKRGEQSGGPRIDLRRPSRFPAYALRKVSPISRMANPFSSRLQGFDEV